MEMEMLISLPHLGKIEAISQHRSSISEAQKMACVFDTIYLYGNIVEQTHDFAKGSFSPSLIDCSKPEKSSLPLRLSDKMILNINLRAKQIAISR